MSLYTKLTGINKTIAATYEKNCWKLKETSFIRNRKMDYETLVKSIIFKKGQTLVLEIDEFTKKMETQKITKQAYSKQRQNLDPKVFKHLNDEYIKKIYEEIKVKRYKKYIVISVDGSTIELPNSEELKKHYGLCEGQKGSVGRVRAKSLGIYDSLNKIMVKSNIDPYNVSEKYQIIKMLDEVKEFYKEEEIIMVFDIYYFGISFINILEEKGIKYLMRMR